MILSVINMIINTKVKQKVKIMTIFEEYVLPLHQVFARIIITNW